MSPLRLPRRRLLGAALAFPLLLTACEGVRNPFGPNPDNAMPGDRDFVVGEPLSSAEFEFIWERAKLMLQTDGYGVDGLRTSRAEMLLVSQWKTILSPARYQGKRRRVVLRFEEAGPGSWLVGAAVLVQRNEDIQDPMQIARAVWKSDGTDPSRAEVLVYKLEQGFSER